MKYLDNTYKMNKIKKSILNKIYIKKELNDSYALLSNINGYSLDKEQRIAVITDEKSNLVIAGAGSGKSLTMVGKIRYLIERQHIKENEILCLSFTKEAANNLENSINKNYNYNIKVYTFHKLALEILKDYKYNICDDYLLKYIVDEFFYIYNNKIIIKKILNMIDTPYKTILNSNELVLLKKSIISFINLFKTNNCSYDIFINNKDELLLIIFNILYLYESELRSTNSIDFNDMIILATKQVNNTRFNYKYIIVDEYQDTSYIRYLLLKEIINKYNSKITCVGDDYQSIYKFSGCNLDIFINFNKYFKHSKILKISNTYRNSQDLIDVAGSFIMRSNIQIYKLLKSTKRLNKPIKIFYGNNLNIILEKVKNKYKNILILGRNKCDIKEYDIKLTDNIKYLTVHSSKGLESDCVIIINLSDNILGFPNKIKDSYIFKYVNKNIDKYPYEEERRLFYVALTRSKNEVYLVVNKSKPSIFVKELIKYNKKYIEFL